MMSCPYVNWLVGRIPLADTPAVCGRWLERAASRRPGPTESGLSHRQAIVRGLHRRWHTYSQLSRGHAVLSGRPSVTFHGFTTPTVSRMLA